MGKGPIHRRRENLVQYIIQYSPDISILYSAIISETSKIYHLHCKICACFYPSLRCRRTEGGGMIRVEEYSDLQKQSSVRVQVIYVYKTVLRKVLKVTKILD
jgi:hypothetical protein